jgi:hypothetical protein
MAEKALMLRLRRPLVSFDSRWLQRLGWSLIGSALLLLGVSISLNIYLVDRVHTLVTDISEGNSPKGLSQGNRVPNLEVTDLRGIRMVIKDWNAGLGTVLYVYQPTCVWCQRNEKQMVSLAHELQNRYRFIGLSLTRDGVERYLAEHPVPFPNYVVTPDAAKAYGLSATPTTLVISPGGQLIQKWTGTFGGKNRDSINKFFPTNVIDSAPQP